MNTKYYRLLLCLVLSVVPLLSACSTATPAQNQMPPVSSTAAQAAAITPLPTNTPTPDVTATPTASPTPEPSTLAASLGLESTEGFTFGAVDDQTVLVDEYNNANKAVLENGVWRKLDYTNDDDAELMYGALVPTDATYLSTEDLFVRQNGSRHYYHEVIGVYLGDYETTTVTFEKTEVTVPLLLVGMRDGAGKLHIFRYASDGSDLEPNHYRSIKCVEGEDTRISFISEDMESIITALSVGKRMKVDVLYEKPGYFPAVPAYYKSASVSLDNNAAQRLMMTIINSKPADMMTEEEVVAMTSGEWPDRLVTVYNFLEAIVTYESCW